MTPRVVVGGLKIKDAVAVAPRRSSPRLGSARPSSTLPSQAKALPSTWSEQAPPSMKVPESATPPTGPPPVATPPPTTSPTMLTIGRSAPLGPGSPGGKLKFSKRKCADIDLKETAPTAPLEEPAPAEPAPASTPAEPVAILVMEIEVVPTAGPLVPPDQGAVTEAATLAPESMLATEAVAGAPESTPEAAGDAGVGARTPSPSWSSSSPPEIPNLPRIEAPPCKFPRTFTWTAPDGTVRRFKLNEAAARRERENLLDTAIAGSEGVRKLVDRNEEMTRILVKMAPHLMELEQLWALKAEMEERHAGREAWLKDAATQFRDETWAQARKIRALEAELKSQTERESQLKEAEEA
ncbi:hypothetical protein E2562_036037, partial [Oryza meyeriana var. granulata]